MTGIIFKCKCCGKEIEMFEDYVGYTETIAKNVYGMYNIGFGGSHMKQMLIPHYLNNEQI